jgi:hypothetical protein
MLMHCELRDAARCPLWVDTVEKRFKGRGKHATSIQDIVPVCGPSNACAFMSARPSGGSADTARQPRD